MSFSEVVVDDHPVTDPWTTTASAAHPRRAGSALGWSLVSVAAGVGGIALRLVDDAPAQAQAAAVLVIAAAALTAAFHVAARRRRLLGVLLALAVTLATWVATILEVGSAPLCFAVVGLTLADASVRGRWALERGGSHPGTASRIALPVLALAQVTWFRHGDNWLMALLLGMAAVLLVSVRSEAGWTTRAEHLFTRSVGVVADFLGLGLLLLVAVPLLYLPGSAARAWRALRGGRGRRDWSTREWSSAEMCRDATRPFASAPPRVRRRRNAIGIAVLAGVLAAGWILLRDEQPSAVGSELAGAAADLPLGSEEVMELLTQIERVPYSERPAYAGVEYADELQADLAEVPLVPHEGVGYGLGDVTTDTVVVRDGARRTIASECAGCPTRSVWLVGGSSVFGMGQRDQHTTASELVRVAADAGIALEVTNLGVPGWTLVQEQEAIRERLADGAAAPDLIVYLHGYNDVVATMIAVTLRGDVEGPVTLDPDQVGRFVQTVQSRSRPFDGERLGSIAADRYKATQREVRRQAEDRGVMVVFMFQPDGLASPVQRQAVDELYAVLPEFHELVALDQALDTASSALEADGVVNLRHSLDGERDPVFVDAVHTNERGARVVAASVWTEIASRVGAGR